MCVCMFVCVITYPCFTNVNAPINRAECTQPSHALQDAHHCAPASPSNPYGLPCTGTPSPFSRGTFLNAKGMDWCTAVMQAMLSTSFSSGASYTDEPLRNTCATCQGRTSSSYKHASFATHHCCTPFHATSVILFKSQKQMRAVLRTQLPLTRSRK